MICLFQEVQTFKVAVVFLHFLGLVALYVTLVVLLYQGNHDDHDH